MKVSTAIATPPDRARGASVGVECDVVRPRSAGQRSKDGSRWRAVAVVQLDRQAHELIATRRSGRQVEALDDPDPGPEQDLVDPGPIGVVHADREVVDPDRLHADI